MKHHYLFWINPEQALNSAELENPRLMIRNINLIFFYWLSIFLYQLPNRKSISSRYREKDQ